jgi:hypothetical protein
MWQPPFTSEDPFLRSTGRALQGMLLNWLLISAVGCGGEPVAPIDDDPTRTNSAESSLADQAEEKQIQEFCGGCHRVPNPKHFSRDSWYEEVQRGFRFYAQSERADLIPPPNGKVVNWFRSRAPEDLPRPKRPASGPSPVEFREQVVPATAVSTTGPIAVSFLDWISADEGKEGYFLFSNMKGGEVSSLSLAGQESKPAFSVLGQVKNPARVEICDLDGNNRLDFVVADLGSFHPVDHQQGKVVWFRQEESGRFTPIILLDQIGRVADVRIGDFNGDQLQDVLVGEFGWIETGSIRLLLQKPGEHESDDDLFESHTIDPRHGVIHLPAVDWNQDGHLDFVALFSQEHETIELFLNDGKGNFTKRTLHPSEDPAFGSSGIQLVDLDQDGDMDILYTNGDTFDSFELKFFHGIQWLENQGDSKFISHPLTRLPGVHRALAGDFDDDGDLDVVAAAFLPAKSVSEAGLEPDDLDSIIWLEQTRPGEFERHSLETGKWSHATLNVADFDGDGDTDFASGNFLTQPQTSGSPLSIWWNETVGTK